MNVGSDLALETRRVTLALRTVTILDNGARTWAEFLV